MFWNRKKVRLLKLPQIEYNQYGYTRKKFWRHFDPGSGCKAVETFDVVTKRQPTQQEKEDLIFDIKQSRTQNPMRFLGQKQNADCERTGQTSRIWALENAIKQANPICTAV
jgi:AICAR transformylase/IMP cyclohydrolase PurH